MVISSPENIKFALKDPNLSGVLPMVTSDVLVHPKRYDILQIDVEFIGSVYREESTHCLSFIIRA